MQLALLVPATWISDGVQFFLSSDSIRSRTAGSVGFVLDGNIATNVPLPSTRYFWKFHFTSPGNGESFVI